MFIKELNWEQKLIGVLLESVAIGSPLIGIKLDIELYFVLLNSVSKPPLQGMSQNFYYSVCS